MLEIESTLLFGILFSLLGIITVHNSINDGRRGFLFVSSALFMVGVVLLISSGFELLNTRGIVMVSILFYSGAVLLLLFIDNTSQKVFLISSIAIITVGAASVILFKGLGLFDFSNRLANAVADYWPAFLIVFGVSLFLGRKR